MKKYINFYLVFLLLLVVSCRSAKHISTFQPIKNIDLNLTENGCFKYMYYQYDIDTLIFEYCTGIYFDLGNKTYTLCSDTFNSRKVNAYLLEDIQESQNDKVRVKIKTNIVGNCEQFNTILNIDSSIFTFQGIEIDTLLKISNPKKLSVEIYLPDDLYSGTPLEFTNLSKQI